MAKKRMPQAIHHFKRAIEIKPEYAPARNNLGTAYLASRQWDKAIETFKEITDDLLYATPHYPLSNLGFAYYNKGEYQLAVQYYEKALNLQPTFAIALTGLGKSFLALGKGREAVETLEMAIEAAPQNPQIYMAAANAYSFVGDYDRAKWSYQKVIQLDPNGALGKAAERGMKSLQ